jgi:hypothetical protein
VLALRTDNVVDLLAHQLLQHPEPDADAQCQQTLLRCADQLPERLLHALGEHGLLHGRLRDRYVATHGGSSFDLWRIAANAPSRNRRGRRDRRHIKVLRGSGQPLAEWQALILGLRIALEHGERHVVVKGDSMLVVRQINREWKTKNEALRSLRAQAEELLARFETWRVEWIPRKENRRTDELGRSR